MGDSEDEYDRKRRDKFRGERAEASYRGAERSLRPRDEWQERDAWSRPRPRDYRGPVRDRGYSPSMESAPKRMRHDFYGDAYYNHYQPYHQPAHRPGNFFREPPASQIEGQQPPMMSFKAFLATQDDNISDSEAIEKYNDYKLEFQRQQLNEFFVAHKDDEWFRLKYHPEDSVKRKEEQVNYLKKRVEVFLDLLKNGSFEKVSVDCARTNDILKLLDTVVVKLEGGTDEDLLVLEQEYTEIEEKKQEERWDEPAVEKKQEERWNEPSIGKMQEENWDAPAVEKKQEENWDAPAVEKKQEENWDEPAAEKKPEQENTAEQKETEEKEEVKTNGDGDQNERNDTTESGELEKSQDVPMEEDAKPVQPPEEESKADDSAEKNETEAKKDDEAMEEQKEEGETKDKPEETKEKKRKRSFSGGSSSSGSSSSSESEEEKNETKPVEKKEEKEEKQEEPEEANKIETIEDDVKVEKPRALHKTTSIFLRSLASTITKQEVEAICARFDGFLRVALADPQPERRWLRRGWVTFKRDANIKEICWNLNNIRLRDCELGAIVNRDLSRRIRPVNGITAHKQVVRSDIKIAAKVTLHMDNKAGLWPDEQEKKSKPQQTFGLVSNNPVLHNITDYLIEEASAEEEELLGLEPSSEPQDAAATVERDDNLISVLDRIILYLRIVHSLDYYNHCEYPNEDEMPNRCGILHARGPPPTSKTDISQYTGTAIETKMANYLPEKQKPEENKNEVKLVNLSLKDVDTEIDKFVQANTRELAKDKWLCPLSGKKFKGPDFVRKHIFNKHAEKIEEVKKEVEFFNNYLRDPKRPMLAEAPQPKREEAPSYSHTPYPPSYGGYGGPPRYYGQAYPQRSRGYPPRSRGGGGDFRPVIHYRDLDAPREPEEFI